MQFEKGSTANIPLECRRGKVKIMISFTSFWSKIMVVTNLDQQIYTLPTLVITFQHYYKRFDFGICLR
jgi:hypothetical protein